MPRLRMERSEHSLITEGVQEHEQTLSTSKPFWVIFVANMAIGVWLLGVMIAGMGLNLSNALSVIFLACLLGCILPGAMAVLGPLTRLSQMEAGRFSLGLIGNRLPAFLNWGGSIGWDVVVNLLAASALTALLTGFGLSVPLWLALGILVGAQMIIGFYGHHLIQDTARYTGALIGAAFIIIGIIAMYKTGGQSVVGTSASTKDIISAFVLLLAYNISSWTTYTADYTRYLPRHTPSWRVFFSMYSGIFLSSFILMFFGYMTASAVAEQTPDGVMKALQGLTGSFAPFILFLVAFGSIPTNAVNDNSAAYSLISAGLNFSRPVSMIFGSLLGYAVCLVASSSFVDFFVNLLFLFAHWILPWSAILLVHWYTVDKSDRTITPPGITMGCVLFVVVSIISIALFSANSLYTGVLSEKVGGADIGPYIGFVVTGASYYALLRLWPQKFRRVEEVRS